VSLIVSDTGPLHYLILCEAIDVLPKLYGRLIIPPAVVQELTHPHTPPSVSGWAAAPPQQWASVQVPSQSLASTGLGFGEREAIALALELDTTFLLVDDRVARGIAGQKGLLTIGTVGVLEQAAASGFLDLPEVMPKLLNTNFRIDAEVVRAVLNRNAARFKTIGESK